jgi:MtaA/CmuA family methyltransferase
MFAIENARMKMEEVVHNPARMADALIRSMDQFEYDGCVIDFDVVTLAEACGAKVIFRENDPAVLDESNLAVKDWSAVDSLRVPDPWNDGRLPIWLDTTRIVAQRVGDRAFVMGRADQGPFTLACMLRGPQQFMMDLLTEEDPTPIYALIDYCRAACAAFAKAQKVAGAHATSIGDAFAGPSLVSPVLYRKFALQPETALAKEVQDFGIPLSIHICGNTASIISDMGKTGARILEVDWQLDMALARRSVPSTTVLMGNVNPSDPLVLGTAESTSAAVKEVIKKTAGRGLFLSSGCALGRNTPPENLQAMVKAVRAYGIVSE